MTTVGDKRVNDWNKLGRGRPNVQGVQDANIRRAFEANQQNIEYLLRKIRDIHPPHIDEKPTDITKKVPPLKPKKPEAVMITAKWVKPTSADITGKVHPHDFDTTYYFQYMYVAYDDLFNKYPDADFTNANTIILPSVQIIATTGSIAVDVAETLIDLVPAKKYYIQLVAENVNGKAYSNILDILDTCDIPENTIDAPSMITEDGAKLSGTVDPNELETTYYFEYGTTPQLGSKTPETSAGSGASPVAVSAILTGLQDDTVYYFKLVSVSACGKGSGSGGSGSFKTLRKSSPEVTNNGADSIRETLARLTGSVDPNGYETTWTFLYGTTHGLATYGLVVVDTILDPKSLATGVAPAGAVSAIEVSATGLAPDTQYWCQLIAVNSQGTSYSDIYGFTTIIPEITLSGSAAFGQFVVGDTGTITAVLTVTNSGTALSTLIYTASLSKDVGLALVSVADEPVKAELHGGESQTFTLTLTKPSCSQGTYLGTSNLFTVSGLYCETKTLPITAEVLPQYGGQVPITITVDYIVTAIDGNPIYNPPSYHSVSPINANMSSAGAWVKLWAHSGAAGAYLVVGIYRSTNTWQSHLGLPSGAVIVGTTGYASNGMPTGASSGVTPESGPIWTGGSHYSSHYEVSATWG